MSTNEPNPFYQRASERQLRNGIKGGQHTTPATDRLSEADEERIAWAAFEAERERLAGVSDSVPF